MKVAVTSEDPSNAPIGMKYGLLGQDFSSQEDKLKNFAGTVPWSYLSGFYQTGCLFFVDPALELEEVGKAFSTNSKDQVQAWLKSADLVKIEPIHAQQWEREDHEFEAVIVSPFVLCRPIARS